MKNQMKGKKGITLIALVITVIVLLILAGVTIATLTGDNGLLQKTQKAKDDSTDAELKEEIQLAWNKVYADYYLDNSETKAERLEKELSNNAKVTEVGNKLNISNYKNINKTFILDIENGSLDVKQLSAVEQAIINETVFYEKNTPLTDEYGNTFIVPKGFKLASDSAEVVTEGIVIEDATYTNTIGSQFVWIPVSKDNKKIVGPAYSGVDRMEKKELLISLGRYTFKNDGTIDIIKSDGGKISITYPWNETYEFKEEKNRATGNSNAVAKNIENFKTKTIDAEGFWIGRYEARTTSNISRTSENDTLTSVTENKNNAIYNYIKQSDACTLSQNMYKKENDGITDITKFESDLINSYAWDTTILFLQEFGKKNYSRYNGKLQNSIDGTKDIYCNICNISSYYCWTTESCNRSNNPCVYRSCYTDADYSSGRWYAKTSSAPIGCVFRPVLYVN